MPYRRGQFSEIFVRTNGEQKIKPRERRENADFPWNVVLELLVAYLTEKNEREDSMFLRIEYAPILLRVQARKLINAELSQQMNDVADNLQILEKVLNHVNEIANAIAPIQ